jgi:hypothetical protein
VEDHRKPPRAVGADDGQPVERPAEYGGVQEQERGEGLVLGGRGHVPADGQVGEVGVRLRLGHLARVPLAVEQHEPADPVGVGGRGPGAVPADAAGVADLIE